MGAPRKTRSERVQIKETHVRDRLFEALKASDADYAEIRFETNDTTSIMFRGPEADNVSSSKMAGGIVRACTRGGWGEVTFDSLDGLADRVKEACACAALVGSEKTLLAESDAAHDGNAPARMKRDFRCVGLDDKLRLVSSYNEIILKTDPHIETSRVAYSDSFRTVYFASTRGAYYVEERPRLKLMYVAIARDGALVQQAWNGSSSPVDYSVVCDREADVAETARRAVELLKAPPCEGGKFTVVLDPELAGVFAHEAFGHLSEADFIYENPKMLELMHTGREMGVKGLNIVDDGTMENLVGTQAFDDEATPMSKTHLIKDGVLVGHLHSLETAAKMDARPTGNARALSRSYPPVVRMTNTYIEGGDMSFEELLAGVDDGIYACGMAGGQTMMEMFTFSAAYGRRIRNGRVGDLVRDVVLTGNVFETLHAIDGFGSDFRMIQKSGGCGKSGQAPLPVTFGSPHIRIRDVVIGGK